MYISHCYLELVLEYLLHLLTLLLFYEVVPLLRVQHRIAHERIQVEVLILCPCALLIVIAKHSPIGNFLLFILNGKDVSDGVKPILGINPIFPICDPLVSFTLNTLWFIDNICKVVPLQSPEFLSKFFNNITDAFILSSNLSSGKP